MDDSVEIPIVFLRKCDMKLIETSRKAIKAISYKKIYYMKDKQIQKI